MTRWLVALLALVLAGLPLQAQTVRVTSGDHTDFTRLVLEYPGPVDWRVGRTADGYELRLTGTSPPYDLSSVFDLIGRTRLAAVWADPATGALKLSVACACHAIPFEFRPGTVVIDLRDGPPPRGSSFEEPLDGGGVVPALAERPAPRPRERPADTGLTVGNAQPLDPWFRRKAEPPAPAPMLTVLLEQNLHKPKEAGENLQTLRQDLVEQLGRGATQGIVEMAPPEGASPAPGPDAASAEAMASVDIRLGDAENLDLRQKGEAPAPLTAEGGPCIADDRLAIADWGDETPVAEQFGPALSNLTGEFDRPDPDAVGRAVRFLLHVGFGAEARSILRAFPTEQEDEAIWTSMARLVDGEEDPASAFSGMAACDTAAALWALMAEPQVLPLGQVQKAAVLRAFSALPLHLRRDFGPKLVDRFLEMKDLTTAVTLRDAVMRGVQVSTPEIELMEAAIEKAGGSPAASVNRLEDLSEDPGPHAAEALAALVIQRAELGQEVTYAEVQALEAFAAEQEMGEHGAEFRKALVLAHAASGDFDTAFSLLPEAPEAAATLWQSLARTGRDSPFLTHAVLPADGELPREARAVATLIAQRLVTLGLAEEAARWLAMEPDPPALLAAKVALGRGNPRKALDLLSGVDSKPADEVRIAALEALGDYAAIASLMADRGMTEDQWAAVSRQRDWPLLAAEGPDPWKGAAQSLVAAPPGAEGTEAEGPPAGPLERDRRLVGQSEATRAAISALLESVPAPRPPTN